MTSEDARLLQCSINNVVRLHCTDGEVIVGKIDTVDVEDGEVVYEMLSTTDESKYEKFDRQPAYLIRFQEIVSVEVLTAYGKGETNPPQ
ncbi:MAG TPA: hypothetical protein VNK82_08385 [Terriglobales bacterium]|nr:hypothetical protein [Terriglobales bacterium]